jgi:hypothetical protein
MNSYYPWTPHDDGRVWHDSELQANSVISTNLSTLTQVDSATAHPFHNTALPFSSSLHAMNTTSPYFLVPQQQTHIVFSPAPENFAEPYPCDAPTMPDVSPHHAPTAPDTLMSALPSTTTSMHIPSPMDPSAMSSTSLAQRPRFPCGFCFKPLSSRSRADTCFFNHIGIKPFACNGACGMIGW